MKDWIEKNKKLIAVNVLIIVITIIMSFVVVSNENCASPTAEKPVLQMIMSPSCPHCQVAYNDIFNNLDIISDKYTLNLVYVGNVDTQELRITGVPTFILYEDGIEVNRVVGFVNTTMLISELE